MSNAEEKSSKASTDMLPLIGEISKCLVRCLNVEKHGFCSDIFYN